MPLSTTASKEAQAFAKYLATRRVLIVDPNPASRSGIFRTFQELGAKTSQITLVNSFHQAESSIQSEKPHVVVAEYQLGNRCGLDLLQTQRQQRPEETRSSLFIIVTQNSSQTAVARAAEEDIDAYILQPVSTEVFMRTVLQGAIAKLKPSSYMVTIDEGKKFLSEGNFDVAEKKFEEAMTMEKAPTLACYYLGQSKWMRKILDKAQGDYEKGLTYNRIHYKCLVGLYELLMSQQKSKDAYEVIRKISQYFPANPKLLSEVLRLAIVTGNYDDIEKYYQVFVEIDERDETLIKYVCAALVVCGKYYLSSKVGHSRALQLFNKAAATGQGLTKILREIILALLDYKLAAEAQPFLERFPPEEFDSNDFLLLRFLVHSVNGSASILIEQGRALLAKGLVDERLYTTLLEKLVEAKAPEGAREDIYGRAIAAFPDRKVKFDMIMAKAQPAKPAAAGSESKPAVGATGSDAKPAAAAAAAPTPEAKKA